MEEKNDIDYKNDDAMLPGFRFHPTDEELVGFYLKRKIQQRPLPIELIKQVDIYKYDPWDLPELATTGEKEWYFYCPRDRKYRNSARPNRVTGAGFWKATGTDRTIYSSDGNRCIGLKKSLVFYRGRAAKAIKTDWMMHEFRLPSLGQPSLPNNKKLPDKSFPPNDAWAICRIFKKTNSMAQRAVLSHSHSLICPLGDTSSPSDHLFSHDQFSSENISCTTEIGSVFQLSSSNDHLQQTSAASFSASDFPPSYRPIINCALYKPSLPNGGDGDLPNNFMFTPLEMSTPAKSTTDDTSPILLNPALVGDISKAPDQNIEFEGSQEYFNNTIFSISLPQNDVMGSEDTGLRKNLASIPENQQRGGIRSLQGFLFSLPSEILDVWKPNLPWDSPTCPSEMSTTYSTNKCYT